MKELTTDYLKSYIKPVIGFDLLQLQRDLYPEGWESGLSFADVVIRDYGITSRLKIKKILQDEADDIARRHKNSPAKKTLNQSNVKNVKGYDSRFIVWDSPGKAVERYGYVYYPVAVSEEGDHVYFWHLPTGTRIGLDSGLNVTSRHRNLVRTLAKIRGLDSDDPSGQTVLKVESAMRKYHNGKSR